MTESTPTQTKPDTTINDLKQAVREASAHERELALEVDELPSKIQQAARQDARRQARAAREGGAGAQVAEAAQESALPALRERQSALPYLRWSAGIRTASLELEVADEQIKASEEKAAQLRVGLEGLKHDADEATRLFQERLRAFRRASNTDGSTHARGRAIQRLRELENEYPGVS